MGSFASLCVVDERPNKLVVGMSINANHLGRARLGDCLTAETKPVHIGNLTHVWATTIRNQNGKLISVVHSTVGVFDRDHGQGNQREASQLFGSEAIGGKLLHAG